MSLEDQQFKKWLRRPTELIASAWFLLASAGSIIVPYIVLFIDQVMDFFGQPMHTFAFVYTNSVIQQLFLFLLPVVIYALKHDGVEQSMRLKLPRWEALPVVLIAPVGVMFCDKLSTWWLMLIESLGGNISPPDFPGSDTLPELGAALLLTALVPAICEETLFRGGMMGAWERRGTKQALVITSVLFALLHGSVQGLPVQLMMGFLLGYIVLLSDSLFVGMAYHFVHNAVILILDYYRGMDLILDDRFMTLTQEVIGTIGLGGLLAQTVVWTALFVGLLALFIRLMKKRGAQIDKIIEGDKEPMSWETLIVLLAGLLTIGVRFSSDLISVCGLG